VICWREVDTNTCACPRSLSQTVGAARRSGSIPRTSPGELLFPREGEREALDNFKITLGSYRYAGQYQQRPAPRGGGIFKKQWWRYWTHKTISVPPVLVNLPDGSIMKIYAVHLPDDFDQVLQSWDMAFKDLKTSDYVCGQVWGRKGANRSSIKSMSSSDSPRPCRRSRTSQRSGRART
jgi:hypothetical protein